MAANRDYINDLRKSAAEALRTVDLKEAAAAQTFRHGQLHRRRLQRSTGPAHAP
ncbi:hypothetical protein [Streptomyces mirabilis]|uniref:hypothetical protein n=1 Tax=Streptomyces mirabilis TaxID=68239 RepID=UPI00331AA78C